MISSNHSDGNSKELITVHLLQLSSTDVERGLCLHPFFLKSTISCLVLLMLSIILFSVYHYARLIAEEAYPLRVTQTSVTFRKYRSNKHPS